MGPPQESTTVDSWGEGTQHTAKKNNKLRVC